MTYQKAVELLKTQFYPDHHKPYVKLSDDTIHQIFQALDRFEGAVEVELRVDGNTKPYVPIPYVIESHKNDFYSNRTEYTKLYAIPKEQQ